MKNKIVQILTCIFSFLLMLNVVYALNYKDDCELKKGYSQTETGWVGTSKDTKYNAGSLPDSNTGVYLYVYLHNAESSIAFDTLDYKSFVEKGKRSYGFSNKSYAHTAYLKLSSSQGNSTHATGYIEAN